jgi:hypothetical protein
MSFCILGEKIIFVASVNNKSKLSMTLVHLVYQNLASSEKQKDVSCFCHSGGIEIN